MIGTKLAHYEITRHIGSGGMGDVYQATDTKLGRSVAIKFLPEAFSNDTERIARFQREARVLASLNHPNIAAIYGVEEIESRHFLVMELVSGETLGERIKRGGISVEVALPIARQIAEALEAAHEHGIIHRDIKPANIIVAADGRVKVLDFGLAKELETDRSNIGLPNSPTKVTVAASGVLLGTAPYMSPEQARGLMLDKRTDIWSLGCVLYEMLAGRPAFKGATISDVIASVLSREPDWELLPRSMPFETQRLLQRCLDKDPRRRMRDMGDVRIALEDLLIANAPSPVTPTKAIRSNRKASTLIACMALSLIVGAVIAWNVKPVREPREESEARFSLPVPAAIRSVSGYGSRVALSPDGSHLVFVSGQGNTARMFSHSIPSGETKELPQTEGATQPFFSPDGRWVAFFSEGKLRKLPVQGGVPVIICDAPAPRGGFWSENGKIVLSPLARGSGIVEVSADGGTPKPITTLDTAKGETSHRLPEVLSAGNSVLFAAYGATYQDVAIVAQSLKTGERQTLIPGASEPHYVSTGHLLYLQPKLPGVLFAVPFDAEKVKITGTPVPVIEDVLTPRGDSASWSLSRSGMLVYAPGGLLQEKSDVVLVSRNGIAAPLGPPPGRAYHFPRISPDGRRLLVTLQGVQNTVWLYEVASRALSRLSFEGNNEWSLWSPDGRQVSYASNRTEPWRLYSKPVDGSGPDQLLLPRDSGDQQPESWSADGKFLLFQDAAAETSQDIWLLSLDAGRQAKPFLQTRASEVDAQFSPDGQWVAYASDESGRYEVYVVPFLGPRGKWQISTEGGREPRWARNGRELFFRTADKMMAISLETAPAFRPAAPHVLFQGPYLRTATITPEYDVTPDDQHFVMIQPSEDAALNTQLKVVLNWVEELKRRVPVR